jgi:predicted short-subunit dehydrogenase-like oxidoreductase (DUF2520 family)
MITHTVAIIGAGRVGGSIGFLLAKAGYSVTAVWCRSAASAAQARAFIGAGEPLSTAADMVKAASGADIVFITTPDRAIEDVCGAIAEGKGFRAGALVLHTSGAHSLDLLDAAKNAGAFRAVIHPLQSLASREQGIKTLPGSYFRIEVEPEVREQACDIVKSLGGRELVLPRWSSDKNSTALYHAGAVAVSNYFVALIDYGLKFYEALGADKQEALKAVLPLLRGTLHNVEVLGIPDALTGPIVRGDVQTVRGHLEAMKERAPELLGLYRQLARHTVVVAREKGSISDTVAEELTKLME